MIIKQLNIKNRTYYFYDDIINLKDFDPSLLKLDTKESLLNIDIYYISYVTKKQSTVLIVYINFVYLLEN